MKNYDGHHIMSAIGRTELKETVCTDKNGQRLTYKDKKGVEKKQTVKDGKITAIVQNMKKLISINYGQYKIVDSCAFLSSSLGRLVGNTPKANLSITNLYIVGRLLHCEAAPRLSIGNQVISHVTVHKHLGVLLRQDLKWSNHIHEVVSKATRKLACFVS